MPSANVDPLVCARCKKKPATETYSHAGVTERVCATCLDRHEVKDAYEGNLIQIITLGSHGQYDEALACLDAILAANRDRDHDRWLARSIAAHRVLILLDAGRYAEAEQACEAQAQLGFGDVWQRWEHALGAARTFEAQGRLHEGVAVLEEALGYQDLKYIPSALGPLATLAELSEKLGQPVDSKWLSLLEAVAACYGVDVPAEDSVGATILALRSITRGMLPTWCRQGE